MKLLEVVNRKGSEAGTGLIDVLVAMLLLSFLGASLSSSTNLSFSAFKRAKRQSLASQLAIETLESLAATNPANLDDADDLVETGISRESVTFNRTTDVTVNADGSRTVTVTVTGAKSKLGGSASYTSTYPMWGAE